MLTEGILSGLATCAWPPSTNFHSSTSCAPPRSVALHSDILPIITSDSRYEIDLTDVKPGKAERLFGSPYDEWADEQLLAKFLEEQKPVESKYDVVPVPGFFRVPREGDDERDISWRDSEGVSSCDIASKSSLWRSNRTDVRTSCRLLSGAHIRLGRSTTRSSMVSGPLRIIRGVKEC